MTTTKNIELLRAERQLQETAKKYAAAVEALNGSYSASGEVEDDCLMALARAEMALANAAHEYAGVVNASLTCPCGATYRRTR